MNGTDKLFISGFPRAGTTLLLNIMKFFEDCSVLYKETYPITHKNTTDSRYSVIKQPFGYWEAVGFGPKYTYADLTSKYGYKVLSMVRDPRDVLVSKHASDPSRYWVELDIVLRNCIEYLNSKNNPNVLHIRYEDLVVDHKKQVHIIEKFIGTVCDEGYTEFYQQESAAKGVGQALGGLRPINTKSIGNWKKAEHSNYINSIMFPDLENYIAKLGY